MTTTFGRAAPAFTSLETGGAVQYWIHRPGDPFHGLLTSRVTIIREGPQTPAFVTSTTQMQ